jgi:hypothetical protein
MKDKKMPFAVFVLKYVENMVKDYKELGKDGFEALDDFLDCCLYCPLKDKCEGGWDGECLNRLKEYVESAE